MDLLSSFLVRADALRTVEWAAKVLNALARLNAYYARASGRGETHLSADLLAVNEELHRALDLSIPAEELDFTALKGLIESAPAVVPDIRQRLVVTTGMACGFLASMTSVRRKLRMVAAMESRVLMSRMARAARTTRMVRAK